VNASPSIAARLVEGAARRPRAIALVSARGVRIDYGTLAAQVAALATALKSDGLGAGDRVLLFVPMSIELYIALLACLHLGATAVFVDAWADRRRLDAAVRAARPRAFLGAPRAHLLRLLSREVRAIPIARMVTRAWLAACARDAAPCPAAEVAADQAALITFTTGSTGTPKAAARSHAFLWAQHEVLAAHLGTVETDVDLPTLPVFVLHDLACGACAVLPDADPRRPGDIDPARVYEQIVRERVTTTTASPAFFERLLPWCEKTRHPLPLRALFTGGAPVLPALARRLAAALPGRRAEVLYGSTEAEPIAAIGAAEMLAALDEGPGGIAPEGLCVGAPVPQIVVRIVRPQAGPITLGPEGWDAWELAPGETGEVVVSGAHVLTGYLDDPEADCANKIGDGARVWHRTGDAARLDDRGRLWLMGRVRERVVRDGRTWWTLPPELRALAVPGVTHAAYLGLPGGLSGPRALLAVECSATGESGLEARLRAAVAPWPVDRVALLERIPRDPRHASKTDLEALRRRLG